jgi:hypothetical protein
MDDVGVVSTILRKLAAKGVAEVLPGGVAEMGSVHIGLLMSSWDGDGERVWALEGMGRVLAIVELGRVLAIDGSSTGNIPLQGEDN